MACRLETSLAIHSPDYEAIKQVQLEYYSVNVITMVIAASDASSDIFQIGSLWSHSHASEFRDLFGSYVCACI